jgi:hypothetical protein
MKTKTLALGAAIALVFGMFLIPAVSAYIPTVPYDALDYPERAYTPRIRDYNPPDYFAPTLVGRERMSYQQFCTSEMKKFETLLGYERAHTRI